MKQLCNEVVMTIQEACWLLRMSENSVRRKIARAEFQTRSIKGDRRTYLPLADVEALRRQEDGEEAHPLPLVMNLSKRMADLERKVKAADTSRRTSRHQGVDVDRVVRDAQDWYRENIELPNSGRFWR